MAVPGQARQRGVDSHTVLVRLAEVLRVDIEEFTGSSNQDETGRRACPAASLIEQAMMGYGASGPVDGGDEVLALSASRPLGPLIPTS